MDILNRTEIKLEIAPDQTTNVACTLIYSFEYCQRIPLNVIVNVSFPQPIISSIKYKLLILIPKSDKLYYNQLYPHLCDQFLYVENNNIIESALFSITNCITLLDYKRIINEICNF